MSKSTLKRNLGLQTFYQIVITITPLITSPYLSRVLRPEGLGVYSYTQSLVNCFMLFAMLGFVNYGTRAIATTRHDSKRRLVFWEIYHLQFFIGIISTICFLFFALSQSEISHFLLFQIFWVVGCIFDATWYFFGREDFKTTVLRNLIIKMLTIVSIFIFVRDPSDIGKYILIMSLSHLISSIVIWPKILKSEKYSRFTWEGSRKHIKPVLILFVPILAMSIYTIMDKMMLGALSDSMQSGYYYNSDKIVNIPLGIINGIGTVMLARISAEKANRGNDNAIKLIKKSMKIIICASVVLCFGIAAVSNDFIPLFFGDGYDPCINLVKLFSIVIIMKTISSILRTQYLVPFKKEKIFIISVATGSIANIIANLILIKLCNLGALGATIGTLVAEFIVSSLELILISKHVNFLPDVAKIVPYSIIGAIMLLIVMFVSASVHINIFVKIILEIIIGGAAFVAMMYLFLKIRDEETLVLFMNLIPKKWRKNEKNHR